MSILPQPPPDAPAPPPGPEAFRSRRKMRMILWLGGLSIGIPLLLLLSAPVFLRARKASERTEALNNIRQIGMYLVDFDYDYGRFPDASTIAEVKRRTSTPLTLTDSSSNQLFRQLLATGLKSEKPFYAGIPGGRRPDDVSHSDSTALQKGECGFSYIAGRHTGGDPDTPVVLAPMKRGTKAFDTPGKWGERAVVLNLDNSARVFQIDAKGRALTTGSRDLFDPSQPWWNGKAPDLKWHE